MTLVSTSSKASGMRSDIRTDARPACGDVYPRLSNVSKKHPTGLPETILYCIVSAEAILVSVTKVTGEPGKKRRWLV
jgi:hypothetical protein